MIGSNVRAQGHTRPDVVAGTAGLDRQMDCDRDWLPPAGPSCTLRDRDPRPATRCEEGDRPTHVMVRTKRVLPWERPAHMVVCKSCWLNGHHCAWWGLLARLAEALEVVAGGRGWPRARVADMRLCTPCDMRLSRRRRDSW